MRIHFISYGGGKSYKKSGKRLKKEALNLKFFDHIKIYRSKDLPTSIKNSFLFQTEERGNGYWIWKPYIIYRELEKVSYGDVVVYSDCGNQIMPGKGWEEFWKILENYDGIFQQYRTGEIYPWGNSLIKRWTKKSMIDFFSPFGDTKWAEQPQFQSCFIIVKKNRETLKLIKSWFRVMWARPDLLIDTFGSEDCYQLNEYGEHRHDQAVLSGILLTQNYAKVYHMPEIVEPSQNYNNSVVYAKRIRDNEKEKLIVKVKNKIKNHISVRFLKRIRLFRKKLNL
ncbi:MAG: hypothetical protein LLF95_08295 [Bacteroidales bacterium]|nr:hypothetical protein [Bacteroidales bacterium]